MTRFIRLPDRAGSAVENMALDLTLLERATRPGVLWFRHYDWTEPAFTFGVSQPFAYARAVAGSGPVLVRRASGGGVVDHRADWTYALVAPAGHALAEMKATASYRLVHEAVVAALTACGLPCALVPCPRESCGVVAPAVSPGPARKPGACFLEAEIHDVVCAATGRKLAGAAQKRTRAGILFQGYVDRAAGVPVDWPRFGERFAESLAMRSVAVPEQAGSWPVAAEDCAEAAAMFASDAWNARR